MPPSEEQIRQRLPVWVALSDFFLDTELQEDDYERIAATLAASPYPEQELKDILCFEVYPVCKWNLRIVAGEWAGFGEEWVRERIAPRYGKRPLLRLPLLHWWMIRDHWEAVRSRIAAERGI